jgi:hypothetical protein
MSTGYPDYLRGFQQPNALYVSPTDVLHVTAATSQTSEVVTVNYRLWLASRATLLGQFTVSPTNNRSIVTADQALQEGFLLSAACTAAVASRRGQTFVRLSLTNSALSAPDNVNMFLAEYVTVNETPGYPVGRLLSPVEGPGFFHQVSISNPAAGHDFSISAPNNTRWKILRVAATLTTSAVAANRQVQFRLITSAGISYAASPIVSQTASSTARHSAGPGVPLSAGIANAYQLSLPNDCYLTDDTGSALVSSTGNLQGADQWANIFVDVEEKLEFA